jgi:hypothetical protein
VYLIIFKGNIHDYTRSIVSFRDRGEEAKARIRSRRSQWSSVRQGAGSTFNRLLMSARLSLFDHRFQPSSTEQLQVR